MIAALAHVQETVTEAPANTNIRPEPKPQKSVMSPTMD